VAEAYHSSLENNNQKFVDILNKKLSEVDKDNVLATITKETEQAHQKNKQMLEETQKLQDKMRKQFSWFKVGIISLFVAFLAFAILSTLLSGVFDVLGITPLYDDLNYTIKHSETIWGNLWYIVYVIPYALLIAIVLGLYWLAGLIIDN
jgi:trehalose-6-phosphate synthase